MYCPLNLSRFCLYSLSILLTRQLNFFNVPWKKVTFSLQKRKHHKLYCTALSIYLGSGFTVFQYCWPDNSTFLMHPERGWHFLCRKENTITLVCFFLPFFRLKAAKRWRSICWKNVVGGGRNFFFFVFNFCIKLEEIFSLFRKKTFFLS